MSCLTSVGKGIVFHNVFQFMTSANRLFYNCVYRGNMILFCIQEVSRTEHKGDSNRDEIG